MSRSENISTSFVVKKYHFGIPWGREKPFLPGQDKKLVGRGLLKDYKIILSVGTDGALHVFDQERPAVWGEKWGEPKETETVTIIDFVTNYPNGLRYSTNSYSTGYKVKV